MPTSRPEVARTVKVTNIWQIIIFVSNFFASKLFDLQTTIVCNFMNINLHTKKFAGVMFSKTRIKALLFRCYLLELHHISLKGSVTWHILIGSFGSKVSFWGQIITQLGNISHLNLLNTQINLHNILVCENKILICFCFVFIEWVTLWNMWKTNGYHGFLLSS